MAPPADGRSLRGARNAPCRASFGTFCFCQPFWVHQIRKFALSLSVPCPRVYRVVMQSARHNPPAAAALWKQVQLIMGKTIERALGREGCQVLLDRVKSGSVVRVAGRVQAHVSPASGASREDVLDVVVSSVEVMFRYVAALTVGGFDGTCVVGLLHGMCPDGTHTSLGALHGTGSHHHTVWVQYTRTLQAGGV